MSVAALRKMCAYCTVYKNSNTADHGVRLPLSAPHTLHAKQPQQRLLLFSLHMLNKLQINRQPTDLDPQM